MMDGLSSNDLNIITKILKQYPEISEAFIFGSRAKGTHKAGSDVDIAIKGNGLDELVSSISGQLNEETPLPYTFDVVVYNPLSKDELQEHIQRVGISFYSK
jgi:predicted nucleotidyltransferase